MFKFNTPVPLSLYIHFPWCVRKCPYCDFNSHAVKGNEFPEEKYIEALIRDLEFELPRIWGRRINSIFLGGGTPSLFSAESMTRLLSVLRSHLNLSQGCEITLEANPGTVEAGRFAEYRKAGINRISIGIQSFDNEMLGKLGRIHDCNQASDAVERAIQAGFNNINIDLMYGLPGQTIDGVLHDLSTAVKLNPTHISWYELTIEPNTVFHSIPPRLPDEDTKWEMQEAGEGFLADNNYLKYEISAYARDNRICSHNLNYWHFGDYLGIGAGAHGKITDFKQGRIERFAKHRIPESFMKLAGNPGVIVEQRDLTVADTVFEFMMNAMRLTDGVTTDLFTEHTGLPASVIDTYLYVAREKGLVEKNTDSLKATVHGRRYLNDLLSIFMDY